MAKGNLLKARSSHVIVNIVIQRTYIHRLTWNCKISRKYFKIEYPSILSASCSKLLKNPRFPYLTLWNNKYHSLCGRIDNNYTSMTRNVLTGHIIQKRNISLGWFDSFVLTQAQWFQSLSGSYAVSKIMDGLQTFHNYSHMPWWLTIIFGTVLLRTTLTFPLVIYQNRIISKVANLHVEMLELSKELKRETAFAIKKYNWDEKHTRIMYNRSARRIWNELILRDNCHPAKATAPIFVQIPFWICSSFALRNMINMQPKQDLAASLLHHDLSCGGFLWLPNLCIPDESFILPVLFGLSNLLILEINVLGRSKNLPISKMRTGIDYLFRTISIALIPLGCILPGGLILFWTTSSMCALLQNVTILHPRIRRIVGVPKSKLEKEEPYKYILTRAKERFKFDKFPK